MKYVLIIPGVMAAAAILDTDRFGGSLSFYLFAVAYLAGTYGLGLLLGAYFALDDEGDGGVDWYADDGAPAAPVPVSS